MSARRTMKWQPIADRLPLALLSEWVLAVNGAGDMAVVRWRNSIDGYWQCYGSAASFQPVAWRYLPEPPQ